MFDSFLNKSVVKETVLKKSFLKLQKIQGNITSVSGGTKFNSFYATDLLHCAKI